MIRRRQRHDALPTVACLLVLATLLALRAGGAREPPPGAPPPPPSPPCARGWVDGNATATASLRACPALLRALAAHGDARDAARLCAPDRPRRTRLWRECAASTALAPPPELCWAGDSVLRQLALEAACERNASALVEARYHSAPFLFELRDMSGRFWRKELAPGVFNVSAVAAALRERLPDVVRDCWTGPHTPVVDVGAWYSLWNVREHLTRHELSVGELENLFDAAALALMAEACARRTKVVLLGIAPGHASCEADERATAPPLVNWDLFADRNKRLASLAAGQSCGFVEFVDVEPILLPRHDAHPSCRDQQSTDGLHWCMLNDDSVLLPVLARVFAAARR